MSKFSFDILLLSEKDFEKVLAITDKYDLDCEQLEHREGKRYLIRFDSDYGEYEFFNEVHQIFEFDYLKVDKIRVGKYDVRINISRSQNPYFRDSWGRPFETDESENWYYVKPINPIDKFPTKKIEYNLKGTKRWVWIGVTQGHNPNTNERGYIVVSSEENSRKPISPSSCHVITSKIHKTKKQAMQDGTNHITQWISRLSQ